MKTITAKRLSDKLRKDYPNIQILETEKDRLVINAEEPPYDKQGRPIFDYWNEDYREMFYVFGVKKELHEYLDRNGWYAEWVNTYTMSFTKQ